MLLYLSCFFYQLNSLLDFDNSPITEAIITSNSTHIFTYSITPKPTFGKVNASMTMEKLKHLFSFIILLLLSLGGDNQSMANDVIRVGEILDLNSTMGEMEESYILMAVSDFYAMNANYRTRPIVYIPRILRMMLLVRHVRACR